MAESAESVVPTDWGQRNLSFLRDRQLYFALLPLDLIRYYLERMLDYDACPGLCCERWITPRLTHTFHYPGGAWDDRLLSVLQGGNFLIVSDGLYHFDVRTQIPTLLHRGKGLSLCQYDYDLKTDTLYLTVPDDFDLQKSEHLTIPHFSASPAARSEEAFTQQFEQNHISTTRTLPEGLLVPNPADWADWADWVELPLPNSTELMEGLSWEDEEPISNRGPLVAEPIHFDPLTLPQQIEELVELIPFPSEDYYWVLHSYYGGYIVQLIGLVQRGENDSRYLRELKFWRCQS